MESELRTAKAQSIASTIIEGAARLNAIATEPIRNRSLLAKRLFRHKKNDHRKVRLLKRKAVADQAAQTVKAMMSAYLSAMDVAILAATPIPKYPSGTFELPREGDNLYYFIGGEPIGSPIVKSADNPDSND